MIPSMNDWNSWRGAEYVNGGPGRAISSAWAQNGTEPFITFIASNYEDKSTKREAVLYLLHQESPLGVEAWLKMYVLFTASSVCCISSLRWRQRGWGGGCPLSWPADEDWAWWKMPGSSQVYSPTPPSPLSPSIVTIIAIFTTNKTIRICSPWAKRAWASWAGSCWRRAGSGRSDSRSGPGSASRSRSGCPCCLRTNISLCKWSCLFLETSQGDLNIIFWGTKTSRHWCIIVKSPVGKLCYAHSCKGLGAADEGLASGGNLQ